MKKITFLDFETTGLIKENEPMPLVIQAALKIIDWNEVKLENQFFWNNNKRLNVAVRTETWIQEKDIKDKELFSNSAMLKNLIEKKDSTIYVAHNGKEFDFKLIEEFWFTPKYYIDTLKIIQYLITDKKEFDLLEWKFKLGYIRFYLQDKWLLDKKYVKKALKFHTAGYDVETLEQIFNWLVKIYQEKNPWVDLKTTYLNFVNISKLPLLLTFVNFWKHIGEKYEDLPETYLKWCYEKLRWVRWTDFDYTIEEYFKKKNPKYFNIKPEKQIFDPIKGTPKVNIENAPTPIYK